MSGGRWNYQHNKLLENAEIVGILLTAVADTERILDWALCGDTDVESAREKVFDLWKITFDNLYGE